MDLITRTLLGLLAQTVLLSTPVWSQHALPPAPVRVAPATTQDLAPTTWFPGTLIGRNDARVGAQAEGRVLSALDVGARVAKGDEIARLDDVTFILDLDQANAGVARARSRLAYLRGEVGRLEKLAALNHVAKSQLDQIRSERDITDGDLKTALAKQALAKDQLEKTRIRAPFPGIITERIAQPGEHVEIGGEIARLVDPDSLEIQAQIPRASIAFVTPGTAILVTDETLQIEARVRTLVPIGDALSHLYELRLGFTEPTWVAGHIVRVAIPAAAPQSALVVPRDALVIRRDGTSVYRIGADNIAEPIPVTLGVAQGSVIAVQGPIEPGDRIVTQGNERLQPGQPVTILP